DSGRILALISQPGFDPNYFWQADEQEAHKALFAPRYDRQLLRPLLVQAAAVLEAGLDNNVLPVTISVPDYGLSEEVLREDWLKLALGRAVPDFLPLSAGRTASSGDVNRFGLLSPVQMVYGLASLLNGGHRVQPWFLHALYDHAEKDFFLREKTVSSGERLLSPIQGIQLRQKLLGDGAFSDERGFLFADTLSTLSERNGLSAHHIQDVLVAAVPGERPEVLLLFTVDYNRLAPYPPEVEGRDRDGLFRLGRDLLPVLIGYGGPVESFTEPSPEKNSANLRRYFSSRKLNTAERQENIVHAEQLMPSLIGLSLRKGLQQINKYNITVRIQGSGRIIEQKPAVGEPLSETETCELILETEHE
ncbi:MAG: PASTA domain-containing protein, partial [Candidatus Electrothrix sp. EH2]|nr:PASTA domain-containing protein [Candidatus Electrothrix sp. EH2]